MDVPGLDLQAGHAVPGATPDLELTYIGDHNFTSAASSFNAGTVSLGAAAPSGRTRWTIVVMCGERLGDASAAYDGCTVGGNSATEIAQADIDIGTATNVAAIYAYNSTGDGTTENITVTSNVNFDGCGMYVYRLIGGPVFDATVTREVNSGTANEVTDVSAFYNTSVGGALLVALSDGLDDVTHTINITMDAEDFDANFGNFHGTAALYRLDVTTAADSSYTIDQSDNDMFRAVTLNVSWDK